MMATINEAFEALRGKGSTKEEVDNEQGGAKSEKAAEGKEQSKEVPPDEQQKGTGGESGGDATSKGGDDKGADGKSADPNKGAESSSNAKGSDAESTLRAELEAANARIAALLELSGGQGEKPTERKEEEIKVPELVLDSLVTKEEFDAAMDDPEAFNKLLIKVAKTSYQSGTEATLKVVPNIVKKEVSEAIAISTAVNEFWNENKDLKPYRKVFATYIDEVQKGEPGLTLDKIFEKAEVKTREKMKIPRKDAKKVEEPGENKQPAFAAGSETRKDPKQPSKLHNDFLKLTGKVKA